MNLYYIVITNSRTLLVKCKDETGRRTLLLFYQPTMEKVLSMIIFSTAPLIFMSR